ncbi:selenocysteine lyase/cysteine desulfurase [Conyzicola lurida]|uniref:Selenocysteine lyase/cysteine desulfurase n=1 Tax=Conyzicola lurida TaxID=1172621 RepID=A0A841AL55_9MICO|nr:aminotransferase class V-fold PLP-dependent enzyme [Conyzicola lurida]MBB5842205.1 selenocysteine lyase/cysteine desulfurase [Conyzicola lurida]
MSDCPLLPVVGGDLLVPTVMGSEVRYTNLDYAASAPALEVVAEHVVRVLPLYASVHRGAGYASQVSTSVYESARVIVGDFVGARPGDEVIFTRNTTDSLNLLASIVPGETVFLDIEHHANLLPWVEKGGRVVVSADTIEQTLLRVDEELARRPAALLTVTGASNVTGETLPLRQLANIAHRYGTRLAVDAAQLLPHRRVNLQLQGIDYLAFSGHKAYAPFGAGVLVGRTDWLDAGPAYLRGGGAVTSVSVEKTEWRTGPSRHEAGSPNVVGVAALARAIQALDQLDETEWTAHEAGLRQRLVDGFDQLPEVRVHRIFSDSTDPVGVVSFTVDGVDSRLLATYLSAEWGIGVRDGKFCAHPLLRRLGITEPALRASFGLGSTDLDADRLIEAVTAFLRVGPTWNYDLVDGHWEVRDDTRPRPEWAPELAATVGFYGCAA